MNTQDVFNQIHFWRNSEMRGQIIRQDAEGDHLRLNLDLIRELAKQVIMDHKLGLELWATGDVEAMLLAAKILDPKELSSSELDVMMHSVTFYLIADWLVFNVVARTPYVVELSERWKDSDKDCVAQAGWTLMMKRVKHDINLAEPTLTQIEGEMKDAPMFKQQRMNFCLANIGINHESDRQQALAIGHRLKVYKESPLPEGLGALFAPLLIATGVKHK